MTIRAFLVWLLLFLSGSTLWMFGTGPMWVAGYAVIFVAFVISRLPWSLRTAGVARHRSGVWRALSFMNILPMFVAGWDINRPSQSTVLKVVYLSVACAAVAINAYRAFARVESRAA